MDKARQFCTTHFCTAAWFNFSALRDDLVAAQIRLAQRPSPLFFRDRLEPSRRLETSMIYECRESLRVGVDPCLGEIDYKPFRFLSSLELIRQSANRMRTPLAVAFPGDFSSRTPAFGALA